jgi:hypothetical protein
MFNEVFSTHLISDIWNVIIKLHKDTLIIFDIDDVLIYSKDQILSTSNKALLEELYNQMLKDICEENLINMWSKMWLEHRKSLVNDSIPHLINYAKNKGCKLMALTSSWTGSYGHILNLQELRFSVLKKFNIDFSKTFSHLPTFYIDVIGSDSIQKPCFHRGILFTCDIAKNIIFEAFLKKINASPQSIVFIDDNLENVNLIRKFCYENNIKFQGIHFTYVKNASETILDMDVISLQLEVLKNNGRWLNDTAAIKLKTKLRSGRRPLCHC